MLNLVLVVEVSLVVAVRLGAPARMYEGVNEGVNEGANECVKVCLRDECCLLSRC